MRREQIHPPPGPGSRPAAAPNSHSCVVVIDDDEGFRESLGRLLRAAGVNPRLFASINDFVRSDPPDSPTCLVLDVRLPERSGLDFQAELGNANILIPIVFITGHGDIPMSVKAMKAGAVEFLTKPLREQDLLDAVRAALEGDKMRREQQITDSDAQVRFDLLTPREQEVMAFVTTGLMNKQVATEMGIAEATVKFHRGHIMRKMAARSLADLIKMAGSLGIQHTK